MTDSIMGDADDEIAELRVHVKARAQHIMNYGPKVKRSDPSIVGTPRWEEAYSPPPWYTADPSGTTVA